MPYRTLCGFPTSESAVKLKVPNKKWRADTVICDTEGTEWFVLMECDKSMRSYEAIFGDLYGHKLVCVRRKMMRQAFADGFYICTYRPNFEGQPALYERDCNNKQVFPFSYIETSPQKGRFAYKFYTYEDGEMELEERPKLVADNPWMGFMTIWCTPMTRCFKWTSGFRRPNQRETKILINQWKDLVEVEPGQDVLAALCIGYIFDVCQRQPFVTMMGKMDPEYDVPDDGSINSDDWDGNTPRRERAPLNPDEDNSEEPSEFENERSDEDDEAPKPKKKKKKKKIKSKYPPAEPDDDPFADCLD